MGVPLRDPTKTRPLPRDSIVTLSIDGCQISSANTLACNAPSLESVFVSQARSVAKPPHSHSPPMFLAVIFEARACEGAGRCRHKRNLPRLPVYLWTTAWTPRSQSRWSSLVRDGGSMNCFYLLTRQERNEREYPGQPKYAQHPKNPGNADDGTPPWNLHLLDESISLFVTLVVTARWLRLPTALDFWERMACAWQRHPCHFTREK